MKFIDTHVHLGDYSKIKYIVENSQYKDKYRLYSAINPEVLMHRNMYLRKCEKFFAIPMVLMELAIEEENAYVLDFCKNCSKAVPVLLVGDDISIYQQNKVSFLKEHFIYHNISEWEKRKSSYEYLNSIKGFLIIHSVDSERIKYIKMLRSTYPDMNVIIAHMGRNVWEDYDFTISVIDAFKDDTTVLFDISTITKIEIMKYAIRQIGSKRILFSSDFPFEFNIEEGVKSRIEIIESICEKEEKRDICYRNAERILINYNL